MHQQGKSELQMLVFDVNLMLMGWYSEAVVAVLVVAVAAVVAVVLVVNL